MKTIQLGLRVTPEEKEFLKNRAKALDISVNKLIRHEYIKQIMNKERNK